MELGSDVPYHPHLKKLLLQSLLVSFKPISGVIPH